MGPVGGCDCSASGGEVESRAGVGAPGTCATGTRGGNEAGGGGEDGGTPPGLRPRGGAARGPGAGAVEPWPDPPPLFPSVETEAGRMRQRPSCFGDSPDPERRSTDARYSPCGTRDARSKTSVSGRNCDALLIKRGLVAPKLEICEEVQLSFRMKQVDTFMLIMYVYNRDKASLNKLVYSQVDS